MKKTKVKIPWEQGLHMRPAARLAKMAARFKSEITLRFGNGVTDATSVLGILMLCAYMDAPIEVAAKGFDEAEAIAAVERFFDGSTDESVEGSVEKPV